MDWFWIIIAIIAIIVIWYLWRKNNTPSTTTSTTAKPTASARAVMVEDIKATKTSRIADVAEIHDELGSTSSNYRHYCELVGTSMPKGVIAPYSQREVAYYDVRCYRIDYKNGQEVETLVAHETSIDPFYFTDTSCDTPVYVDLASFGTNVILVNSTNHIEGPNSEFSKKLGEKLSNAASSTTATACMASVPERLGNALEGATNALERLLLPGGMPVFGRVAATAVAGSVSNSLLLAAHGSHGSHGGPSMSGSHGGHGGPSMSGSHGSHGGHGGYGMGMGGRPPMPNGGGAPSGNYGNMGGLGGFMGQGMGGNFSYGGRPYSNYGGSDLGTTILNVGLGALLGSLYSQPSNTTTTYVNSTPQSTFRGYRLIEDVVPISSPIYCIGEVYRHGTDLYIGRSTDETYTTSFFATKPESEVVAHLKG